MTLVTIFKPIITVLALKILYLISYCEVKYRLAINICLRFIFNYVPDKWVPTLSFYYQRPITIISSVNSDGKSITNKMCLFINLYWDYEIDGIDIDKFTNLYPMEFLWIEFISKNEARDNAQKVADCLQSDFKETFNPTHNIVLIRPKDKQYIFMKCGKKRNIIFGEFSFNS